MAQAPDIPGTFAAVQLVPLLHAADAMGLDSGRLLAQANLHVADVKSPGLRLPCGVEFQLWSAMEEMTGDPLIGLRVSHHVRVGALGAYEYLVRNSVTLREAVARANRFELVIDDLARVSIVEDGEVTAVRLWRVGGYPHPPRTVECVFAALARSMTEWFGPESIVSVQFQHCAPCDPTAFETDFGCPVRFAEPHHQLCVATRILDEPIPNADPLLGEVLEGHLEHLLTTVPREEPLLVRARQKLSEALSDGDASVDGLAKRMGMGARTLRRRLDEHGTSFSALLDGLRHELALQYLDATDLTLDEVAARLGFSEASTFYRAFKRWVGTTPATYRARRT